MPNTDTNGGLSLEALLAAARGTQEEAPAQSSAAPAAETPSPAASSEATEEAAADPAVTEAAEPVAEPSAVAQEEALEKAEKAAPAFDLAAALGYGSQASEPAAPAKEPEEKFDLAAALGYKSQEVREREAAEAAAAKTEAQVQAVQAQAYREAEREAERKAERQARQESAANQAAQARRQTRGERVAGADRTVQASKGEEHGERTVAAVRETNVPQVRSRSYEPSNKAVSPEKRYAAKTDKSATAADGSTIESYQPTKRDRSAQARAARPLRKEEVSEVAQAIAADAARTEYVDTVVETKSDVVVPEPMAETGEKATAPLESAEKQPVVEEPIVKEVVESAPVVRTESDAQSAVPIEVAPVQEEPVVVATETVAAEPAPVVEPTAAAEPLSAQPVQPQPKQQPQPQSQPQRQTQPQPQSKTYPQLHPQPKPSDVGSATPAPAGQPIPVIPPAEPPKPATMPHKVPVRTTEEIINPVQTPVRLGVISPEVARHEAAAKKKVQSTERKIVKKVRRFRTLGMFLIVIALAALAGAIFLFVAGNASASESIEATATEICEQAGRTITYRYKAADSNGTLCPTTEVATFSAGDVLEQSVITMNTPDFETAAHTLANFKKQFEKSSYVDGRVDGSTVIFTLHMSNERIMKVTYTALLMKNTTGCEVII